MKKQKTYKFQRILVECLKLLMVVIFAASSFGCRGGESAGPAEEKAVESDLLLVSSDRVFEESVLKSELPVLVDFWAPWCPPCRTMDPIIKKAASQFKGSVGFAKVNVDDNKELAGRFNIRAIPTFMLFYQGNAIATYEGAMRASELDLWIHEQLKQAGVTVTQAAM